MDKFQDPRSIALCICSYDKHILVFEGKNPVDKSIYYRPVGGGIEFREYGHQTVKREFKEELGLTLKNINYLFTLENIFEYNNQWAHEIALIYDGELEDKSQYCTNLTVIEGDPVQITFPAYWISSQDLKKEKSPLYPDGLLPKLTELHIL